MGKIKILGVKRAHCFSPNSVERDNEVFSAVTVLLEKKHYDVNQIDELDFVNPDQAHLIFTMGRSNNFLTKLKKSKFKKKYILNSVEGINCCKKRSELTNILLKNDVPLPPSWTLSKNNKVNLNELDYPVWFKRGDDCSQEKEDIVYIENKEEALNTIYEFQNRGIFDFIITKHIEGDLIKFYGVEGTDFFYYYYPTKDTTFSKFGNEQHNSKVREYPFCQKDFMFEVNRTAALLNVPIYGGDAIITADGKYYIIDFNDWPSFSICRNEAANAIVELIERRIKNEQE